ncbi:SH3 domain-containing protein [Streptomyces sp. ME02-8801-2C]|uniref:SH3 domain-containing protein n=1 Tax=Streptomyces sp. ME02-8801-2C TaxID=3028680 RepID=UPI0029A5881F|nr:SH3 domain-containing protein [Streptomyces sp. ME02-8801-2C]MDX3456329.1 SH3 domain-containing protein [Streptomyces sp. ME02-8801-2C]
MSTEHIGERTADEATEREVATSRTELKITTTSVRTYAVAPGYRLNVRSGPGTSYTIIRVLSEGARVPIYCQRPGEAIAGPYGTSNIWDNIDNGEYVSDAYVLTGSDGYVAAHCS